MMWTRLLFDNKEEVPLNPKSQSRLGRRTLAQDLREIGRRCAALPDLDRRSADEIIGYNEIGLPD